MNIYELQKLVNEGNLEGILDLLKGDIAASEYYNSLLKNNHIQEPEIALEAMQATIGLYGVFMLAAAMVSSYRATKENKKISEIKASAAVAKAKARVFVSDWARLESLLESYAEMNKKNSSVCQSILSYYRETYNKGE